MQKYFGALLGLTALATWGIHSPKLDIDIATPVPNQRYIAPPNARTQTITVNGAKIYVWSRADSVKITGGKATVWTRARIDSIKPAIKDSVRVVPVYDTVTTYDTIPTVVPFYDTIPIYDTTHVTVYDTVQTPAPVGIGFGAFNAAPGTAPLTMYLNANSPANLKTQLAAARAGHYRVFAIPTGGSHANYEDPATGLFSLALWTTKLNAYRADSLVWRDYGGDGTLAGLSINDEPQCASCWGGQAIPWAVMDSAAGLSKKIFRGVPHFTRTNARQFNGYAFRHLDGGMLQYSASMGNVATWTVAEIAEAKLRGYALMAGVNAARGGAAVAGCIVSPVDAAACAMSGVELTTYLTTLASDSTVVCGLTAWGPDAAWWTSYLAASGIRPAASGVAAWAAGRRRPACLRR
jgi:hypothetical protein